MFSARFFPLSNGLRLPYDYQGPALLAGTFTLLIDANQILSNNQKVGPCQILFDTLIRMASCSDYIHLQIVVCTLSLSHQNPEKSILKPWETLMLD